MPRRLSDRTLQFLSAGLYVLAFPKFNLSFLAWIALLPLTFAVIDKTPRQAFWLGWRTGFLAYVGLLYWLITTFRAAHQSYFLATLTLAGLASFLALYWGAWTHFIARMKPLTQRIPWVYPFLAAAAWVAMEYLRTYLFSGFPWALLGDSQWRYLPLIQIVSVTGVYGVSFLIVAVNTAVAQASLKPASRAGWRLLMTALFPVIVCIVFGTIRLRAHQAEPPEKGLKVALLQGSIDQYQKWDRAYVAGIEQTYEDLVEKALTYKPALIVWPETSIPGYMLQDPELTRWLKGVVQRSRTYHLVGAPSPAEDNLSYNSAFSLDPDGRIIGQYEKRHLVPFGEIVPWASMLGRWVGVLNDLGGFKAGERSPVVLSGIGALGINICYEAIFPNLVRQSALQGAEVLANLTNDGWYMRTAAPYQHFIPNIFRAVENDRWLIRADNTGITAIVSPVGEVQATSPIYVPTVIYGEVLPRHTLTFYTRFGDVFAWLCIVLCFIFSIRAILARHDEARTS